MNGPGRVDVGALSPNMALVRAIHSWSQDHGLTPLVLVDATMPGVEVPMAYVREGKIVLNIHPNSVKDLVMDDGHLLFSARFSGRSTQITLPIASVLAVYARENGRGVIFQPSGGVAVQPSASRPQTKPEKPVALNKTASPSRLKLVK